MDRKTKKWIIAIIVPLALFCLYKAGPSPHTLSLDPSLPAILVSPTQLEKTIAEREAATPNLKPDNQARIVWFDSTKKGKTPYSIVYLHGFSACWKEGDPVHRHIAQKFGCNLLLPRLYAHGLQQPEPLLDSDPEKLMESAKLAIAEAKLLGEKVIVMSTSTGSTLGLYLAADNPDIAALILYSPNVDLYDNKSFLLTQPWGLQIARKVLGSDYFTFQGPEEVQKYWNTRYRIEALIGLKSLLQTTMKEETFRKVTQPVLMCYYYKNEQEQDHVVSVPAMLTMFEQLGTAPSLKQKVTIPNAEGHALASDLATQDIPAVEAATASFIQNVLKISPVQ